MDRQYDVYIVTNFSSTVLYTGVTNNLCRRVSEHYHNRGNNKTFAGKYYCYFILFYETYTYINDAIAREKEIKGWTRHKKMELIKNFNPSMRFLNEDLFGEWPPSFK